jgi:pyruvate dehydrogenase E2 component (dihydrolipoamide acetyltransferase)
MEEGKIVRWLRQEGDKVNKGDEILEVETEKVNVALEAPGSGILRKKLCAEGDTVQVGSLIGIIADADENIQNVLSQVNVESPQKQIRPAPQLSLTGTSQSTAREPLPAAEAVASPRARRLARERGIDLSRVKGSGPRGRIVEEDVLRLAQQKTEPSLPFKVLKTIPLSGQRKAIADRMLTSLQTKAQITITTEVDMTEVKKLRERVNEQNKNLPKGVSYNDLLIRAVALTLTDHRIFNALMIQDELKVIEEINIGLAVAIDDGLVVPVVKNADKLSVREIARKTSELAERAKSGRLNVADVSDGTFTITNLGMFEVDVNTAIINPPQCAILAVGRIIEKPVVLEGRITPRHMMTLGLTFDHRVTDGVPAAKFLQALKVRLESQVSSLAGP